MRFPRVIPLAFSHINLVALRKNAAFFIVRSSCEDMTVLLAYSNVLS